MPEVREMAFRLTPEAQARAKEYEDWAREQRGRWELMNPGSLVASVEMYMKHADPKQWAPGEPVYDATLWHIILPELLRRIKDGPNT